MNLTELVDEAFRIGMSQVRREAEQLAGFLAGLGPRHAMEIGSARGGTFYMLTRLCTGTALSLDLPGGIHCRKGVDYDAVAATMRNWSPRVVLVRGDSRSPDAKGSVLRILADEPLDFLFIDGDHTFQGISSDYSNYAPLVRPGGWVGFHDIVDSPRHRAAMCEVARFWRQLPGEKVEIHGAEDWGGIGLLRVGAAG